MAGPRLSLFRLRLRFECIAGSPDRIEIFASRVGLWRLSYNAQCDDREHSVNGIVDRRHFSCAAGTGAQTGGRGPTGRSRADTGDRHLRPRRRDRHSVQLAACLPRHWTENPLHGARGGALSWSRARFGRRWCGKCRQTTGPGESPRRGKNCGRSSRPAAPCRSDRPTSPVPPPWPSLRRAR
jgi:hypothetical protein